MKIIKQELEFEECLKQRLEFICEFAKVSPTFVNGSIRRFEKTNLTYIEPHRVIIKNITLLVFNYSEEQADLIMRYVDDIELALVGKEIVVKQINFRDSICKPCQELYDTGYIDTAKPMILGNVLGSVRFSNYLPEEEVGEIIMRLRQYYDVHYTEATYYVQKQMFYFNFVEDNSAIVRVFPLEDYHKLDTDNKMEEYQFGILYINEEDRFEMQDIDTAFVYTSLQMQKYGKSQAFFMIELIERKCVDMENEKVKYY